MTLDQIQASPVHFLEPKQDINKDKLNGQFDLNSRLASLSLSMTLPTDVSQLAA